MANSIMICFYRVKLACAIACVALVLASPITMAAETVTATGAQIHPPPPAYTNRGGYIVSPEFSAWLPQVAIGMLFDILGFWPTLPRTSVRSSFSSVGPGTAATPATAQLTRFTREIFWD
jgi:hypothetical protein